MNLVLSLAILATAASIAAAYAVRVVLFGRTTHARVVAEGRSPLLGSGVLEMLYWSVIPVAGAMVRGGVSADAVTWASLALGVGAGIACGAGQFGVGALLAILSAAGDAVDGFVARETGTASDRGEVLDAAADRYAELAVIAGVAVSLRESAPALLLALAALGGSFMVSYTTAKAEALGVRLPRGPMRRTERAVVLILGMCLTPVAGALNPHYARSPIVAALGLVAVLGNASVITRVTAMRAAVEPRR